ncbi:MAG: response regulator transcription factor [Spirochaetaceae bacterium]|jgi:DNA-binding response OmpR family regulator|nr:response regulator transcription factor [Spirochaetaceae bacterium]
MNKQTILVVDDEPKIRGLLKSYLEANGYNVLSARNGKEGLDFLREQKKSISLVLLDLMLPDFSGEEFCVKLRQSSGVPVIIITAKVDEENIINGLGLGADDYVCKPFSPRQLVARVAAALRREALRGSAEQSVPDCHAGSAPHSATHPPAIPLQYEDLALDTERRLALKNGNPITLTRDEYKILTLLMSRRTKIFTRDEILDAVKGEDYYGFDRSIDSHIKRLRAKIGDNPKSPKYITTVYGIGYRFGTL